MTISSEPTGTTPGPIQESETVLQTWGARIPVLTNPSAWFGVSVSLGGGSLVLGLLFFFISKSFMGFLVALAIFCGLMTLFVLIGAMIDLFGGFRVTFFLTGNGVRSISGAGAKTAANTAIVGGILAGNLTGIGVGAMARSEQNVYIPWGEVSRVKVSPWRRYILIKGDWAQKPIGLYCNADNFTQVLQTVSERCPAAQN